MPTPEMFPPAHVLRKVSIDVEDLTIDFVDGVRVTLRLELDSGTRATIMSRVFTGDDVGSLPDELRALGDAFLWGEGTKSVVAWSQRLDRAAMSKRVRSTL